jgi:metallo-beta-lactamase family protein
MKVQFCGAAQQVTGSAHLLTLENGYTILLDCGLYQGHDDKMKEFNTSWLFDPATIDCMVLSHAHIDHTGRIPKLVKDGFHGNIYCTPATRDLSSLMLLDSAKIQESDAEFQAKRAAQHGEDPENAPEPLYTREHAMEAMTHFVSVTYEKWFRINENIELLFRDAGHILGSASVTLRIFDGNKVIRFGFTGDVGRPNRPILRDPMPMPEVDYLICESTYGDRDHPAAPAETARFLDIIRHTCLEKRGKLIIPAFSIGRTQEIVYILDRLSHEGKLPRIPVYVDSPLAVNATQVFIGHPECFDEELHHYMVTDENPFGFNNLKYLSSVEDSKKLNATKEPCIIISASGMGNAGRIRHHLFNSIGEARNTVLIVGYCAPETPGGKLRAGDSVLHLLGEYRTVKAEVAIMDSFSAHGDRHELLDFIVNQQKTAKKVFLVHGEIESQTAFKQLLQQNGFRQVEIPALGDEVQL